MVERPSDPTQPVRMPYGTGRLADGQVVPHAPRELPLATGQFIAGCVCTVIVVVLMAVGILTR